MSNWINVKDQLPENEMWAIAWDETNQHSIPARYVRGDWEDIYIEITHWQPFPNDAPPKYEIAGYEDLSEEGKKYYDERVRFFKAMGSKVEIPYKMILKEVIKTIEI